MLLIALNISRKKNSKYVNIYGVNRLYFIVDKIDGFTEEKEEIKFLNFVFTQNDSEVIEEYAELWNELKI